MGHSRIRGQPWPVAKATEATIDEQGWLHTGDIETMDSKRVPTRTVPRMVRRTQLREIVPLSDTTIYEMEQRGEFPRPFYLTSLRVLRPWRSQTMDRKSKANVARQGLGQFAFPGRPETQVASSFRREYVPTQPVSY